MVKSPSSPLFFATLFCQGGSLEIEIEIMVIARFSLQQSRQFIFIAKWHFRSKNSTISWPRSLKNMFTFCVLVYWNQKRSKKIKL